MAFRVTDAVGSSLVQFADNVVAPAPNSPSLTTFLPSEFHSHRLQHILGAKRDLN